MARKQKEYPVTKPMYNPPHPGLALRELVVKPLKLTVGAAAERLDIDRTTLSRLLNGRIAISTEMAMRIAKALNTTPDVWLGMQQAYDLWQIRHSNLDLSRVKPFPKADLHSQL